MREARSIRVLAYLTPRRTVDMQVINSRDVPHISQRATVVPAVGASYRRRSNGQIAKCCGAPGGLGVILELPRKFLVLTMDIFWDEWIHADLYDPARN